MFGATKNIRVFDLFRQMQVSRMGKAELPMLTGLGLHRQFRVSSTSFSKKDFLSFLVFVTRIGTLLLTLYNMSQRQT